MRRFQAVPSLGRGVHDTSDEECVPFAVRVLGRGQFGQRTEARAATGHVHVRHGALEGGGGKVWSERVQNMFPLVLVYQEECDLQ